MSVTSRPWATFQCSCQLLGPAALKVVLHKQVSFFTKGKTVHTSMRLKTL